MSCLSVLRPEAGELGMLLRIIIILSCLNQINHWNKPTQYKKQVKKIIFFTLF